MRRRRPTCCALLSSGRSGSWHLPPGPSKLHRPCHRAGGVEVPVLRVFATDARDRPPLGGRSVFPAPGKLCGECPQLAIWPASLLQRRVLLCRVFGVVPRMAAARVLLLLTDSSVLKMSSRSPCSSVVPRGRSTASARSGLSAGTARNGRHWGEIRSP